MRGAYEKVEVDRLTSTYVGSYYLED